MSHRGYTVLGWAVWQIASRIAKRKLVQNRVKLRVAGAVALVAAVSLVALRAGRDD
jgi:hypothetical protein